MMPLSKKTHVVQNCPTWIWLQHTLDCLTARSKHTIKQITTSDLNLFWMKYFFLLLHPHGDMLPSSVFVVKTASISCHPFQCAHHNIHCCHLWLQNDLTKNYVWVQVISHAAYCCAGLFFCFSLWRQCCESFWLLVSVSWLSGCGLKHHAHALHNAIGCYVFQQFAAMPDAEKCIHRYIID